MTKLLGIKRKFGGKVYDWVDRVVQKTEALSIKDKLVKSGRSVRITKTGYGTYEIWKR